MIRVTNIGKVKYEDYDEVWAIVRSMQSPNPHIKQVTDIAPSVDLLTKTKDFEDDGVWSEGLFNKMYVPEYIKEMQDSPKAKETFDRLVQMDKDGKKIALVCYCPGEKTCHRSIAGGILKGMGADVTFDEPENDYLKYYEAYSGAKTVFQALEDAAKAKAAAEKKVEVKEEKNILGEVKDEMYGSIHSHAEDMFDTGNDLKEWMLNFMRRGAKKVALTGHGSMFAYEDLKSILKEMKKVENGKSELPPDYPFEIIPGVEIYFSGNDESEEDKMVIDEDVPEEEVPEEEASTETDEKKPETAEKKKDIRARHMVLIARNYEGYKDLCRVVSDASRNTKATRGNSSEDSEYLTPLVTMDNLKKNIRKGNVVATSACVGGVFAVDLGMIEHNLKENLNKEINKAGGEKFFKKYDEDKKLYEEYVARRNDGLLKPKANDRKKAQKEYEKTGDMSLINAWEEHDRLYQEKTNWLAANKIPASNAKKEITKAEKKMVRIEAAKERLDEFLASSDERIAAIKEEYKQFEEIFGKENFYFELQNHGLPFEKTIFNRTVRFAYDVGNPHFIASNDVHIGDIKGSKTWDQSVLKRKVERFKRYKNIEKERGDEQEYGIKSDAELTEALKEIIEPCFDAEGKMHSPDDIISEAIGNIKTVLEPCHVVFPEISVKGLNHYPKFCDNEGALLRKLVEEGVKNRFPGGLPEGYRDRIEYELDIIHTMGFDGYFLIVQDYLAYSKLLGYLRNQEEIDNAPLTTKELDKYIDDHKIPRVGMGIGPGRGSATGCLCSYLIGITELDPIPYGLFFERFLNPSRATMPDIDSDFKDDIREKVYEYIKAHYGDECVSKVATKSYTHGKLAVDLIRQYMLEEYIAADDKKTAELLAEKKEVMSPESYKDYEKAAKKEKKERQDSKKQELLYTKTQISNLFDSYVKEKGINTANHPERGTKALEDMLKEDQFTEDQAEMVRRAIEVAGIPATLGMHACACLISGDPLRDVIPLAWNEKNQKMTTQCLFPQAEDLGLLKMDLLNIKNLTVITRVMQDTNDNKISDPVEVKKILTDGRIYKEIYSEGKTLGIFQVESPGMTKMMKEFKPTCFEDIILLLAAYRPGPMEFIPEMIKMKRHREDPVNNPMPERTLDIDNKELQEILAPTYGVPIYQEQVMQIFQKVAGYNLADADNVRRFMSKKKMEPLQKEKPTFINGDSERGIRGCVGAGMTKEDAELLFDKLVEFSKYAFNKSHAAGYAMVSMYTAYQKLYHPLYFYKNTLSNEIQDNKKKDSNPISKYMEEMKTMGIGILPPKIGKSRADFAVENEKVDENGVETGNVRIGYGNIKGQSYKEYNGDVGASISDFIIRNPGISLSTVATFIKLGMFDRCWNSKDADNERVRVGKSRTLMLDWLEKEKEIGPNDFVAYGSLLKEFAGEMLKLNTLGNEVKSLDKDIKKLSEKDGYDDILIDLEAEYAEKSEQLNKLREDFNTLKERVLYVKETDLTLPVIGDTTEAQEEFINYETTHLGFPFSIEKEAEELVNYFKDTKISSYANLMEHKDLSANKEDRPRSIHHDIPAVVISCTKKTARTGSDYYVIKMMDKNKQVFSAPYFKSEKPMVHKANFSVEYRYPNEKYGESLRISGFKPLEKNIGKTERTSVELKTGEIVKLKTDKDTIANIIAEKTAESEEREL